MKYKYEFVIHTLNHSLFIKIQDVKGFGDFLEEINTESLKDLIIESINKVLESKSSKEVIPLEQNGIIIYKDKTYWFDGMDPDHTTFEDRTIETTELRELIEIWWKKFQEFYSQT